MERAYQNYRDAGITPTPEHPLALALNFGSDKADFSKLWIDQTAARRQLRIAGLGSAVLGVDAATTFEEPSQKDDTRHTVAGFSSSGESLSAIGGKLLPQREHRQTELSTSHKKGRPKVLPNYEWPEARININKSVIVQRVGERQQRFGITREEAYAAELDRSLRRGIWEQAKHGGQIMDKTIAGDIALGVNAPAMAFVTLHDVIMPHNSWFYVAYGAVYAFSLIVETQTNKLISGLSHIGERRWSATILPGAAFDRLAAAGIAYTMDKPIITAERPKSLRAGGS